MPFVHSPGSSFVLTVMIRWFRFDGSRGLLQGEAKAAEPEKPKAKSNRQLRQEKWQKEVEQQASQPSQHISQHPCSLIPVC